MSRADVVAFGAHPDDAEIGCGGTLIKLTDRGAAVVVIDLTRGERGTRGDPKTRAREALKSAEVLGLHHRETMDLEDGGLTSSPEARRCVAEAIRRWRPRMVLLPYWEDRHPDHMAASRLIYDASFVAGLTKIETGHPPYRPERLVYYMGWHAFSPTFIVDVTAQAERKLEAIYAFESQFCANAPFGPPTRLTSPSTDTLFRSRMAYFGSLIGSTYGEGFFVPGPLNVQSPLDVRFSTF
jgi:N-acetylglucosamine malate deacetylase 1